MPVKLDWLEELIIYCLYSTFLKNEYPVSLLIVAPPEHAKTFVLSKYASFPTVLYLNAFTRMGMLRDFKREIEMRTKRTIIIPDLTVMSAGVSKPTFSRFLEFLKGLIEEGVKSITTYYTSVHFDRPIRMNVLTSLTPIYIKDKRIRRQWIRTGLLDRFLVVSYSYSDITISRILEYIYKREWKNEIPEKDFWIPVQDAEIKMDKEMAKKLTTIAFTIERTLIQDLGLKKGEIPIGIRRQRQLQTLALARALLHRRKEVTWEDINRIETLAQWMNLRLLEL